VSLLFHCRFVLQAMSSVKGDIFCLFTTALHTLNQAALISIPSASPASSHLVRTTL
jgi:hypothetical protein